MSAHGGNESGVSRRHARLVVQEGQRFLIDLNSTNFTFLNGEKLQPGRLYPLKPGDEIRFGLVNPDLFRGDRHLNDLTGMSYMLKLDAAALHDPGKQRAIDEDRAWWQIYMASEGEPVGLFVVCDGIGGQSGRRLCQHVGAGSGQA